MLASFSKEQVRPLVELNDRINQLTGRDGITCSSVMTGTEIEWHEQWQRRLLLLPSGLVHRQLFWSQQSLRAS